MNDRADIHPSINNRELIATRELNASPEVVFDIWTNPVHISE